MIPDQSNVPIPGFEPGPPGWKPGVTTTRLYGNVSHMGIEPMTTGLKVLRSTNWANVTNADPWTRTRNLRIKNPALYPRPQVKSLSLPKGDLS
jgi:hypothetical protein